MVSIISFTERGSFHNIEKYLKGTRNMDSRVRRLLEPFGQEGVRALAAATPVDTSLAAHSWDYRIDISRNSVKITWFNRDVENGFNVAVARQYGYSTGTGGYVEGIDYINPALKPIFERISDGIERVVKSA